MQIFEFSFKVRTNDGRVYDERFLACLRAFVREMAKAGLILEGGVHCFARDDRYVCRVIAQDGEAISEQNMSYDGQKALERLLGLCEDLPRLTPCEELDDIPHCTCERSSYYILSPCAEWEGSPVRCGDCRRSVPLYRIIPIANERDFDDLLGWSRLYRSFLTQYQCGYNALYAYNMLKDCVSDLSLQGRSAAGKVERRSGIITLYPLFSQYELLPNKCPQCGGNWINQYRDAVPYERFCRSCRIVM
ncbi:MAG: DUF2310 family Zn-ribbon-containing protein [Clostridia bacterium]|nr:DUF2310 family Zn-ribbon-containing protein [Clostridia bacterium]